MLALIIEWVIKSVIILAFGALGFAYMTWYERRAVSRIQARIGPNRAGPFGLLQPIADGVKLIFKEDIIPAQADKIIYTVAPVILVVPAFMAFAVIPIGSAFTLFGRTIPLYLADVNIAILYLLALSSLAVYGIVLAGWASNNKYALLGGLRSSAQMISYELAMGVALVSVVLTTGTFSLVKIVDFQAQLPLIVLQPLGFFLYAITALAEVNRAPFDLPEAEQELIAGYHIEYSGLRFALFYMAEYISMLTVASIAITLFLGGWRGPFLSEVLGPLWFFLKLAIAMFIFIWLRATFPRLRYDRLMNFGWKALLPLSLANVIVTAIGVVLADSTRNNVWLGLPLAFFILLLIGGFVYWGRRRPQAAPVAAQAYGLRSEA